MQTTLRNPISPRVADARCAEVKAWLVRRMAWEQRLRDLETDRATRTDGGAK